MIEARNGHCKCREWGKCLQGQWIEGPILGSLIGSIGTGMRWGPRGKARKLWGIYEFLGKRMKHLTILLSSSLECSLQIMIITLRKFYGSVVTKRWSLWYSKRLVLWVGRRKNGRGSTEVGTPMTLNLFYRQY